MKKTGGQLSPLDAPSAYCEPEKVVGRICRPEAAPGTPAWIDITNRALALGTLWVTMFLVRRFQPAL